MLPASTSSGRKGRSLCARYLVSYALNLDWNGISALTGLRADIGTLRVRLGARVGVCGGPVKEGNGG